MHRNGDTNVKTMAATEAQDAFGRLLDEAQREPVMIQKKGRNVAVVLSVDEYERLEALDDAYWIDRAKEAEAGGFLGPEESEKVLKAALNATD